MGLARILLWRLIVGLAMAALSLPVLAVIAFFFKPDLCEPLIETVVDLDVKQVTRLLDGELWPEGSGPEILGVRMSGDTFVSTICASILTAFMASVSVTVSMLLLLVSPLLLIYKTVFGGDKARYG